MWRSVSSAREPLDLITLLVHAAMVPATEHGEIRPDLHDIAVPIAAHHNAARVARQALRRFRGNARAPFEDRLARRITVGQHGASTWTTTW
jgi:hypothetical protein